MARFHGITRQIKKIQNACINLVHTHNFCVLTDSKFIFPKNYKNNHRQVIFQKTLFSLFSKVSESIGKYRKLSDTVLK